VTLVDERITAWRSLALAVLERAVQDAVNPTATKSPSLRRKAQDDGLDFLHNPEREADRKFWCDLASLDYRRFTAAAAKIVADGIDLANLKDEQRRHQLHNLSADEDDDPTIH